ncbi:hypothetical protein D1007_38325 [Hordeum vulgare]|nr:hypothetical protein D1007_38325 [Hordeum vulgare]
MALPTAANDDKRQFTLRLVVDTHVRLTALLLVYTNKAVRVERSINTMEQLLAEDKYKVVGFNLEYTRGPTGFFNNPDYTFATVDTTNNVKVLKTMGLAYEKLVDIPNGYRAWGGKKYKESLVDLVVAIIDPYYTNMKDDCNKNKSVLHRA